LLLSTYSTYPRDLHSFPTRRSSDLPLQLPRPVRRCSQTENAGPAVGQRRAGHVENVERVHVQSQPHALGDRHHLEQRTERVRLRSEEHTSELQSPCNLVCRLLLEKK